MQTGGPILAFVPTVELLADAVRLADGNALGVVEHAAGEVAGWAAAVGAIDLATGAAGPEVDLGRAPIAVVASPRPTGPSMTSPTTSAQP